MHPALWCDLLALCANQVQSAVLLPLPYRSVCQPAVCGLASVCRHISPMEGCWLAITPMISNCTCTSRHTDAHPPVFFARRRWWGLVVDFSVAKHGVAALVRLVKIPKMAAPFVVRCGVVCFPARCPVWLTNGSAAARWLGGMMQGCLLLIFTQVCLRPDADWLPPQV